MKVFHYNPHFPDIASF